MNDAQYLRESKRIPQRGSLGRSPQPSDLNGWSEGAEDGASETVEYLDPTPAAGGPLPPPVEEDWLPVKELGGPAPYGRDEPLVPLTARLSVMETVLYHPSEGQPTVIETRHGWEPVEEEQPYVRRITVGGDWQPLPEGWLKEAGMLVISHLKPRRQTNPPLSRRENRDENNGDRKIPRDEVEDNETLVEVGVHIFPSGKGGVGETIAFGRIRAGCSVRFEPIDLGLLRLRRRSGEGKVSVAVFPK